jgi:hypothetical protein
VSRIALMPPRSLSAAGRCVDCGYRVEDCVCDALEEELACPEMGEEGAEGFRPRELDFSGLDFED